MNQLKETLIKEAENRFGLIKPCATKNSIHDCFTVEKNGIVSLWFNSSDNSTHVIQSTEPAVYDVYQVCGS